MTLPRETVKAQALAAAARLLREAAEIVKVTRKPARGKRFHYGNRLLTVRLFEGNVIKVYDENTGELRAVSKPGQHSELAADFMPPTPALKQSVIFDH